MTAGHAVDASNAKETDITIHIEGDDKAMIRPNKIMRGRVRLMASMYVVDADIKVLGTVKVRTKKTIYSSQLRIKVS